MDTVKGNEEEWGFESLEPGILLKTGARGQYGNEEEMESSDGGAAPERV